MQCLLLFDVVYVPLFDGLVLCEHEAYIVIPGSSGYNEYCCCVPRTGTYTRS